MEKIKVVKKKTMEGNNLHFLSDSLSQYHCCQLAFAQVTWAYRSLLRGGPKTHWGFQFESAEGRRNILLYWKCV